MNETENLKNIVLAPWIIKATALIGQPRWVGGNMFRHQIATLGILLDYKMMDDPVLLKASVIHDLIEDMPDTDVPALRRLDYDGNRVVELVLEVTKVKDPSKPKKTQTQEFLKRILVDGSRQAKILKVADRISNITDLHIGPFKRKKMQTYLDETETYIIPMAQEVNNDMYKELNDLIKARRKQMKHINFPNPKEIVDNFHPFSVLPLPEFRIKQKPLNPKSDGKTSKTSDDLGAGSSGAHPGKQ
jgi:GTP pyrophosphokinase